MKYLHLMTQAETIYGKLIPFNFRDKTVTLGEFKEFLADVATAYTDKSSIELYYVSDEEYQSAGLRDMGINDGDFVFYSDQKAEGQNVVPNMVPGYFNDQLLVANFRDKAYTVASLIELVKGLIKIYGVKSEVRFLYVEEPGIIDAGYCDSDIVMTVKYIM
jgi:hypothetical protein